MHCVCRDDSHVVHENGTDLCQTCTVGTYCRKNESMHCPSYQVFGATFTDEVDEYGMDQLLEFGATSIGHCGCCYDVVVLCAVACVVFVGLLLKHKGELRKKR